MDISNDLSTIMQAKSLQAARASIAAAQAQPATTATPAGPSDVILQLSAAAQQLLQG